MSRQTIRAILVGLLFTVGPPAQAEDPGRQLERATQRCNYQEAEEALRNGANPNAIIRGEPALMYCHKHTGIIRMLLEAGAVPNVQSETSSQTPLMRAAHSGHLKTVKLLLDAKAQVDFEDPYGQTALYFVAEQRNGYNIIQDLIDAGARVNIASTLGVTPLMRAAASGNTANMQLLLKHGADIKAVDEVGRNVIWYIVSRGGHIGALQLATSHGADVNHSAKIMLVNPSNPNARNTPLIHAVHSKSDAQMIEALLEAGANPNVRDINGDSPLDIAKKYSLMAITELLEP